MSSLLIHDHRAMRLSARTIGALHKAGIRTWDDLVAEAKREPNLVRAIDGLGPKGVKEILIVLGAAQVDHTIKTRTPRGAHDASEMARLDQRRRT